MSAVSCGMGGNARTDLVVKLVDVAVKNLEAVEPTLRGRFLCPLCLGLIDATTNDGAREITAAHVYPKALGGKLVTVTCRRCNNRVGSEIEPHLINWHRFADVMFGASTEQVFVRVSGAGSSEAVATLHKEWDDAKADYVRNVTIRPDKNSPAALKSIGQHLERAGEGWELKISHRSKMHPRRGALTLLHSIYLLLFHVFGYEWVFNPVAGVIREQLDRPSEDLIDPVITQAPNEFTGPRRAGWPELYLLHTPLEWMGFVMIAPRPEPGTRIHQAIWLPAFAKEYAPGALGTISGEGTGPLHRREDLLTGRHARRFGRLMVVEQVRQRHPGHQVELVG